MPPAKKKQAAQPEVVETKDTQVSEVPAAPEVEQPQPNIKKVTRPNGRVIEYF